MNSFKAGICLVALLVSGCTDNHPKPADLQSAPELGRADAGAADSPDLAGGSMCTRCDAVLNPCPALGLDCNPATECCVPKAARKVRP